MLAAVCLVALPLVGQVTLDGDLTDLVAVAQASRADLPNEICAIGRSGFDITNVFVYLDIDSDELLVGLDLMDVPPGVGLAGVGVPGDADGDGSPDSPATNVYCVAPPFVEQDGVGAFEEYVVLIDTDSNGVFTDAVDIRVRYQDNHLGLSPGDSDQRLPHGSADIQLGTVGAPGDTAIPDTDENRNTADIEIRINQWSRLTATPMRFQVQVIAGAFQSGLPLDQLDSSLPFKIFEGACAEGSVNDGIGDPINVLFVNGSAGGPFGRVVFLVRHEAAVVSLETSPSGPPSAEYALWAWLLEPTNPSPLRAFGSRLGCTVNPTPLRAGRSPQPIRCLRSAGMPARLCRRVAELEAPTAAPFTLSRSAGFAGPIVLTLQAILEDDGSSNAAGFSVTNALTLEVK